MVSHGYLSLEPGGILCEEGDYRIGYEFETPMLYWTGGEYALGWHYDGPLCAVMDVAQGWCAVGGTGLQIRWFPNGFPSGAQALDAMETKDFGFWTPTDPPPDGAHCWMVEGLWYAGQESEAGQLTHLRLHAAVQPGEAGAGLYEVDLITRTFRRL